MTHQESQDLKSYLKQQFGEVRERVVACTHEYAIMHAWNRS
jgi:hypothetical protein